MAKPRTGKELQSLWDEEDDDDDDGGPNGAGSLHMNPKEEPEIDYKWLYNQEVSRRVAAEEEISQLQCRIKALTKEIAVYKGFVPDSISSDEDEKAVETNRPHADDQLKSSAVSTEWQLLAEQERERRQRARSRNTRGVSKKTTIVKSKQPQSEEDKTPPSVSHPAQHLGPSHTFNEPLDISLEAPKSKGKGAISTVLNWDSSSGDDNDNDNMRNKEVTANIAVSTAHAKQDKNGPTAVSSTSEWDKLAQEERDRKQRARQRQLQQASGRGRSGRPAANARRPISTKLSQTGLDLVSKVASTEIPVADKPRGERRHSAGSMSGWSDSDDETKVKAAVDTSNIANRPRDDSFFDSENSDHAEEHVPFSQPKPDTRPSNGSSATGTPSLEAGIDQEVLSWAHGKSISQMIQTCNLIFPSCAASLGPQWHPQSPPPQDPPTVRKAFLLTVRCCHPDKQSSASSERQLLLAAKVFAALTDAYTEYKTFHNIN